MNPGEPGILHSTDPVITLPIRDLGMEKRPEDLEMGSMNHRIFNDCGFPRTRSLSMIDGITGAHHAPMIVFLQLLDKGRVPPRRLHDHIIAHLKEVLGRTLLGQCGQLVPCARGSMLASRQSKHRSQTFQFSMVLIVEGIVIILPNLHLIGKAHGLLQRR